MFLIGYDIGSSSVKVALVDAQRKTVVGLAQHPEREMAIRAPFPDWAEQDPVDWWEACCAATRQLLQKTGVAPSDIVSIGIAYQMHGLVAVDKNGAVLRPSIIWCDSRAVDIGQRAFEVLGEDHCLKRFLNSPGNFTASKLRWVQQNEPELFARIHKVMLPGDYIAYRMTGELLTTVSGLSEGVLWDFVENQPAFSLLDHWGIPHGMLPNLVGVFAEQGRLHEAAAQALGLQAGTLVGYRAGDQPNNALALNALRPGDVAATGGTSGVVYAVAPGPLSDPAQSVNSFAHVNYSAENPLTGVLMCINGAGSAYRWLKENVAAGLSYDDMEKLAASVPVGSEGLRVIPFGNGAERMLGNQNTGASITGIQFNRHGTAHLCRATLEGIAFAFAFGIQKMEEMGISAKHIRTGNDNLFRSAVFAQTLCDATGIHIEVLDTNGAIGAAKASGVAAGAYQSAEEALGGGAGVVRGYWPGGGS
jgi:xylulokinase